MHMMKKYSTLLLSAVLVFVGVFYTHFANVSYLQADFRQKEVISWMNTLVTEYNVRKGIAGSFRLCT